MLYIHLLGHFDLTLNDKPLRLPSRKAEALFAYLVCQSRPLARETLATLFWDESTPEQAMANLRKLLSQLRKKVGDYLVVERQTAAFNDQSDYWLDVAEFKRPFLPPSSITNLQSQIALYRNDFLAGLQLPDARDFEAWMTLERERYKHQYAETLRLLTQQFLQQRHYAKAIPFAQKLLEIDPLNELSHRQMMLLLARAGKLDEALAQYQSCVQLLQDELGVSPTQTTQNLNIRLETAVTQPADLPEETDLFFGREAEQAQIDQLLSQEACRLLTLLGPGGTGKTRLALHIANGRQTDYLHGVHFVSFAELDSASGVLPAISDALNLQAASKEPPLQQLQNYLRFRETLLILDNCETLFTLPDQEGVGFVAELLQACPQLTILATSRERLNLQIEQTLPLAGLDYPEAEDDERAIETNAVRLFAERARAADKSFRLTAVNLPFVARICQLVVGMPLALELAAAMVRQRPLPDLAEQLTHDLDILVDDDDERPERHASLRVVFESSWQQLLPEEQAAFQQLAYFQGGFSVEAAIAVARAHYLDVLGLVDKSFLQPGTNGRYHIHELLQYFAKQRLTANPAAAQQIAENHADYFLNYVPQWESSLPKSEADSGALFAMRSELPNIRLAWQWAAKHLQTTPLKKALPGISYYYLVCGPYQAGVDLLETAVANYRQQLDQTHFLAEVLVHQARLVNEQGQYDTAISLADDAFLLADEDTNLKAAATLELGRAAVAQGQFDGAQWYLEEALRLINAEDRLLLLDSERKFLSEVYQVSGVMSYYRADRTEARHKFETALEIERQLGNRWAESGLLNNLGIVAKELSDFEAARHYHEQNLQLTAQLGDRFVRSKALINLGTVLRNLGDLVGAQKRTEEALRLKRQLGDGRGECLALNNLGNVSAQLGAYDLAEQSFRQALTLYREMGRRRDEGMVLSNLGLLAHLRGDEATAVDLSQQAIAITEEIGDRITGAFAYLHLGHGLLSQAQLAEATKAYKRSLTLRQEMNDESATIEAKIGLAAVALAEEKADVALIIIEPILAALEAADFTSGEQPYLVFLVCYRVLRANADGRAPSILEQAHTRLLNQANQLTDETAQKTFLENVKVHRQIVTAVAQLEA